MNKIYKKFFTSRIFLLMLLGWYAVSGTSCTTAYYTPNGGSYTGTTSYCVGATAAANTFNYTECVTSGILSSGVTCTRQWYYNTTGGTSIGTSTPLGAPVSFTSSTSGSGSFTYTPLTATAGTYYYFVYITWTTAAACTSPFTSTTQTVVVAGAPGAITGPSTMCTSTTITLANSTGGGTWTSTTPAVATISAGGVVSGLTAGTTTISYNTGCGAPAIRVVTVTATAAAITGPSSVCQGFNITLADATPGGTWTSSATGIATVGASTGVVNGVTAGTAIITYSTGCSTPVTQLVSVNPNPAAITGPSVVCEAATITLADVSSGGTWSSGATTIATAAPATGIITGILAGTVNITYQLPTGCNVSKNITVNPLPGPITGTPRVCEGLSATLANAIPGGVWSSSAPSVATISATGVMTGWNAGNAIISYTNGCGSATKVATIDPNPAAIVGRDTACQGGTTAFADITTGGNWSSSNTGVATVLTGSGLITAVAPGTSTITYLMPGGCYTTKRVAVVPMPSAITGVMQVCPGTTTNLFNTAAGGIWSSSQPFIATVNAATGAVTGVTADTVTIVYKTAIGCSIGAQVTVNPAPLPILGEVNACAYLTDTLYDNTPGGVWSTAAPGIATVGATTGIVTTVQGGSTNITYTLSGTGCFAIKTITVQPAPAAPISYNYFTKSFYTLNTYPSYQWYDHFGPIAGANTYLTAALYDGVYYVVVGNTSGCKGESTHLLFNQSMVSTPSVSQVQVKIYPNPSTETVYIEAPVKVRAVISGVDGKIEMERADATEMNISKLASGLYFITLYDAAGTKIVVQKLVKQ